MKYVKLILNFAIKLSFFYLFFLTWISIYSKNIVFNFLVAGISTIIVLILLHLISQKKDKKRNIKKQEKKAIENTIENLRCLPSIKQKEFINSIYDNNTNSLIYININTKSLNEEEFYLIMQNTIKHNKNNVKVFCVDANTNLTLKCQSQNAIEIEFFDKNDIYNFCKQKNIFPKQFIQEKSKTKYTIKVLLSNLLNTKHAKQFFAFSALMLIFSVFSFFKTYYIISSTVFLCLALICLFEDKLKNKKINPQK